MGWLDDDNYLYLGDRREDMILTGGANVYPAEVEAAIQEHPDVRSVAVIGLPDDDLGNIVHAIDRGRPGHRLAEGSAVLRRRPSCSLQGSPLNRVHGSAAPERGRQTPAQRPPRRARPPGSRQLSSTPPRLRARRRTRRHRRPPATACPQ